MTKDPSFSLRDPVTCGEVQDVCPGLVGNRSDLKFKAHTPLLPPGVDGLKHFTLLYFYWN